MDIFDLMQDYGHEQVVFCHDEESGLKSIIAIHDTTLGPALGGTRMWPYRSTQEALIDGCKAAAGIVEARAPDEAAAFSRFLLDVAHAAAGGAREGGIVGVGFRKVSEGEERALASLALALGLPD